MAPEASWRRIRVVGRLHRRLLLGHVSLGTDRRIIYRAHPAWFTRDDSITEGCGRLWLLSDGWQQHFGMLEGIALIDVVDV